MWTFIAWVVLIVLVIIVAILIQSSYKFKGGAEHRLIVISGPMFSKTTANKVQIKIPGKVIKLDQYNTADGFDEDRLVRDISTGIKRKDVILLGNVRIDQTRIKPDWHIHLINLDLNDKPSPYSIIAENKQALLLRYDMSEQDWNRYWDDLCHMNVNTFVSEIKDVNNKTVIGGNVFSSGIPDPRTKNNGLKHDYDRFLTTLSRINVIKQSIRDNRAQYEAINCLERWTLSMLNANLDPWAINTIDSESTAKMISEFKEKHLFMDRENETARKIVAIHESDSTQHTPTYNDGVITYGKYRSTIDPIRLDRMIQKTNLSDTAAACMRYTALVGGSQQWMVPATVYKTLRDKYDIQIEGFASPINSQIMALGGNFCSLFPEDHVFGSLGNFWDLDLTGKRLIINSPFIEPLLDRVADQLERTPPDLAMVVVPSWKDARFYKKLQAISTSHVDLLPGEYTYEDIRGSRVTARFPSTWFVVGDAKLDKSLVV